MIVAMVALIGQGNPAGSRRAPRRARFDDPMTATVAVAETGSSPQPCRFAAAASGADDSWWVFAPPAGPPDDDEVA
jgi:hypothetical protein